MLNQHLLNKYINGFYFKKTLDNFEHGRYLGVKDYNVFTNARLIHWALQKWRPEVAKKEIGVEIGKKKIRFKDEKSRGK